jgi:hypothetical protein
MHALLAAVALAAAPGHPAKVAALSLEYFQLPKEQGDFFFQQLIQELTLSGLQVLSKKDVEAVLGLERQKQLLGCSDQSSSCMAELASALGADGILQGNIGKIGGSYQLNFKIISASSATPLAVYSGTADSDKGVLTEVRAAAASLKRQLSPGQTGVRQTASFGARLWVPVGIGLVLTAAAVTCFIASSRDAARLNMNDPGLTSQADVAAVGHTGTALQISGWATAVTAVAAFVAAAVLTIFFGDDRTVAWLPTSGLGGLGYAF